MKWNSKKGKRTLDHAGFSCQADKDGAYRIRDKSGNWSHFKASDQTEAMALCEDYVRRESAEQEAEAAQRAELIKKTEEDKFQQDLMGTIDSMATLIWYYAYMTPEDRVKARKVLFLEKRIYVRDTVLKYIDDDKHLQLIVSRSMSLDAYKYVWKKTYARIAESEKNASVHFV